MDDFRQQVVDAAVRELRHQLGDGSVDQHGTRVQVDGSFKMARVAEYILRTALDSRDERIIEEVARALRVTGGTGKNPVIRRSMPLLRCMES